MLRAVVLAVMLLAGTPAALAVEPVAPPTPAPAPGEVQEPVTDRPIVRGQRRGKGSGFWTSDVPADDHPYRWGHMAVGAAVGLAMLGLVIYLVRKHGRRSRA
jgi:hypothetical protein